MTFVFNEERVQVLDTRLNSAADQLETIGNEVAAIADSNGLGTPTPGLLVRIEDRYRRISVALNALRDGINSLDVEFLAELFGLPRQTVQVIIDELEATGNLTFENVLAAIIDPARIDSITDLIDPTGDPQLDEVIARIDDQLLDDLLDGTLDPDNLTDQQIEDLRALAKLLSPDTPADEIDALSPAELVEFVQNAFNDAAEQRRSLFDLQQQGRQTLDQFEDLENEGLDRNEIADRLGINPEDLDRTIQFAEALSSIDPSSPAGGGNFADIAAGFDRNDLPDLTNEEYRRVIDSVVVPLITGASSIDEITDAADQLDTLGLVFDVLEGVTNTIETVTRGIGDILPDDFGGDTFEAAANLLGEVSDFFGTLSQSFQDTAERIRNILTGNTIEDRQRDFNTSQDRRDNLADEGIDPSVRDDDFNSDGTPGPDNNTGPSGIL